MLAQRIGEYGEYLCQPAINLLSILQLSQKSPMLKVDCDSGTYNVATYECCRNWPDTLRSLFDGRLGACLEEAVVSAKVQYSDILTLEIRKAFWQE